jgi:hypothetical protein
VLTFDVVIVGGGAAGLMCAIAAGRRGRKVALLEHNREIGRKILISGGGRCNFTNIHTTASHFVSQNPHFCKSALAQFTADDFIKLVQRHHIAFHEKKHGQLFCDQSARQIVEMLKGECEQTGVQIILNTSVRAIQKADHFHVQTSQSEIKCTSLVIATGGLSIPKIGASDFGFKVAEQFGLQIVKPSPALDGFVFAQQEAANFEHLSGVSLDAQVSVRDAFFREDILFTHVGLSGPAALQASLYWQPKCVVSVNLIPQYSNHDLRR